MIRLKHFSWSVMLASGITLAAGSTASAQLGGNLRNGLEQGGRTFGNAGAQMRNNISRGSSTIGQSVGRNASALGITLLRAEIMWRPGNPIG